MNSVQTLEVRYMDELCLDIHNDWVQGLYFKRKMFQKKTDQGNNTQQSMLYWNFCSFFPFINIKWYKKVKERLQNAGDNESRAATHLETKVEFFNFVTYSLYKINVKTCFIHLSKWI